LFFSTSKEAGMSETTQLMLTVECAAKAGQPLAVLLEQCAVACVIIVPKGWQPRLTPRDESESTLPQLDTDICQNLVQLIQSKDTAALIANDPETAKATGADGCHFDPAETLVATFETARRFLGADASIGTMPGVTRHQAMSLAEAGAAYMGYSVTAADHDDGVSLMAWWAEIFETPVVAFTDGSIAACKSALTAGPPDFLGIPFNSMAAAEQLGELNTLIEEYGQLPKA